jgi:hypothetical protein
MFQTKGVEEIENLILISLNHLIPQCRTVYEIRKNKLQPDKPRDENTIRRMRCACWITKAKGTR